MSDLLQFAEHPDADQLTAFAEHALPAPERDQTLAHLSACADCRRLIYLAQGAEPVDDVQPVAAKKPWFAGWNLLWPAAAALAGIVAFSAYMGHVPRHGTTVVSEGRKVEIATEALPIPPAPPLDTRVRPPILAAPKPMPRAVAKAVTPAAVASVAAANGALEQQTIQSENQQFLGVVRKREKTPGVSVSGRMTTQLQVAGAAAPPVAAQRYSQAPMSPAAAAAPAAAPAKPPAAPLAETLRAAAVAAPLPAKPSAAPQAASRKASQTVTVTGLSDLALSDAVSAGAVSVETASANVSVLGALPNGEIAQRVVAKGSRTLALGTDGALYVSKNKGKYWTPVATQWSGRVGGIELNAASSAFELTTDAGVRWTSKDGQKWKRR